MMASPEELTIAASCARRSSAALRSLTSRIVLDTSTPSGVWLSGSSDMLSAWARPAAPAGVAWTRVSPPLRCQTLATSVLASPFTPVADTISTP